ncbi:hypothetical protein ES707_06488 [subsurface metagenome]
MPEKKKVYTIAEAAKLTYYSERSIRQMCLDGKFPSAYKIADGRKWLIPTGALLKFKESGKRQRLGRQSDEQLSLVTNVLVEATKKHLGEIGKPYEETPHKQKMRELAKALAERISLPSLSDEDLWRDLPVEFEPGKYPLPIGVVEIGKDDQIKVKYYDISAGVAAPHLIRGLFSHLSTSRLSRFTELVGDKGKFGDWVSEVRQYSETLLKFLKLIVDEVKGYKDWVSFRDEAKAGLTKWFLLIVWNDAIQKASGYSWIDDSWYYPPESIPNTSLWQLRCGAYRIGIARSKKGLKTYENWHKKLRGKYTEDPLAKGIGAKYQELTNTAEQIRQRLQEFSDMERLPGHCKLC